MIRPCVNLVEKNGRNYTSFPPEIDGLLDPRRRHVGKRDLAPLARGVVGGVEDLEHRAPVLSRLHRLLLPHRAAGEVPQLLGEAVVPDFFVHGERVALGRPRLLHRVTVALLAVREEGRAPEQVGPGEALAPVDLAAIVHSAPLGPRAPRQHHPPPSNSTMQIVWSSPLVLAW